MKRRALLLVPLALVGLAATPHVPWEDLTEADWLYAVATRFSTVDGHRVHYPTPTAQLAAALAARTETAALRHLAEARLELGDRAGAVAALEKWAEAEGPSAWAEAARWGAAHADLALAFRAAARALDGLAPGERRALADERVGWADAHPEAADPIALRQARAETFPDDGRAAEAWIRALEHAGRLAEADTAVATVASLPPERRLLLRSDLQADQGNHRRGFEILDAALDGPEPLSPEARQAYAQRTDKGSPGAPDAWRSVLERAFEPRALLRLATYFQGHGRGDAAADLLRQVDRRYESGLDRKGWLLLARLHAEIDEVPEAFRDTLAAAQKGSAEEQTGDVAALVRLALRAGGRPLPWGSYSDEPYRWVARLDRTPGFWTGGVSFLLTGQDWKDALARLESESLPVRTFATARALFDELLHRAPAHPEGPRLRLAIMARHVERGEGQEALALLPLLEAGPPEVAQEARRQALLAMRQVEVPLPEELRLIRARLRALGPDGSRPGMTATPRPTPAYMEAEEAPAEGGGMAWRRPPPRPAGERYRDVLEEAVSRLEERDRSHRRSLELLLGEMDRMPDAEGLWADLARRLEAWNLDDELGPRYERALERFQGPEWWHRAARWHAARARRADLERLAGELAARFRGAEIFERAPGDPAVTLEIPEQPPAGARVRLVAWADWVRLRALERFPHSPLVFREALGRLVARGEWERRRKSLDASRPQRVVVEDSLVEERRWALLFTDPERREEFFAGEMKAGRLEARLAALERATAPTPVEDLLSFEGWSRLSHFERATASADRLALAYPGDGSLARRVLSLHRSLAALDPAQAAPAAALVARAAPALEDPNPLWTELGELEQERGRSEEAKRIWRQLLERNPRSPGRISELATLLWDYGHMADAMAVIEDGRKRLERPRLLAFEAGVLREELRDIQGAVREYLEALRPESGDCFCSFEREQRSLRRLAQLLGRERVRALVRQRIESLKPGLRADEQALASLFPLAQITLPEGDADWTADDWIDALDQPRDPVGRAERGAARAEWRPQAREGIVQVGESLLAKTLAMIPRATDAGFLDAADEWSRALVDARWGKDREVTFRDALLARRAELASSEEDRIAQEVARARYLFENGRREQADAVWAALSGRIGALPDGAPRLRAEADRAGYYERTRGVAAAAEEWERVGQRYPWSLGILEDRLAFLARNGRGGEGRKILEATIPRAAPGHREPLLARLTREALEAQDLGQARRVVERLLAEPILEDGHRLSGVHLLARLSSREDPAFDALALARAQAPRLKPESRPDLYMQLARAAGAEKAWGPATTLWIEALNRRLDRGWLREACRDADKAGRGAELLAFFEKQQARSPRDVRWAVAVREIRLQLRDIEGAIEMAKVAVSVRPDRESLWREAADLLVRADRVREAADFLEQWSRPRPADEEAARRRSELYARAGDADKALAVEQAALEAFARERETTAERQREGADRRGRAARRLREYGCPQQAWRLLSPDGSAAGLRPSGLSAGEEAQLALAAGKFLALLRHRSASAEFLPAAATVLREHGRPEQKEEVQAWLLGQLLPAPTPAAAPRFSDAALRRLWPFVLAAGMEPPLRAAIARVRLATTPGPWQAEAPAAFVQLVGQAVVGSVAGQHGRRELSFLPPPLERLWVRDLVRRDNDEALWAFLEPRWQALLVRVRADAPLPVDVQRVAWASWLDDRDALAAWSRAAASRPERIADVASVLSARGRWDRLWALAARNWDVSPLVAQLPEAARAIWFRQWQVPSPLDPDPVLRARGETVERVSTALGRLVAGAPGAVADPLVAKLRGPRTVGDMLGKDLAWTWPELAPRRTAAGEIAESGDDRVIGQGADAGRLPGALWGDRPGAAWYALEALARFREHDGEAPFVPMEAPQRGRESERSLLAVRLAEAEGDAGLALELEEAYGPSPPDAARLRVRLRLLVGAGRRDEATAALEAELRRQQPTLTEAGYRGLRRLAEGVELPEPLGLLDPAVASSPGLLAYLCETKGPAVVSRFRPRDPVDFRTALAHRWASRQATLNGEEVRFFLAELWAKDAAPLPERGLRALGGLWPHAGAWLARLRPDDRAEGLAAIATLPDTHRLEALVARDPDPTAEVVRLLRLRVHLARHEKAEAIALLDEMLGGVSGGKPLAYEPVAASTPEPEEGEDDAAVAVKERPTPVETDPLAARLAAWLGPFREAQLVDAVAERFLGVLRAARESGPVSAGSWRLALELTPAPAARAALLQDLEQSWRRGDWRPEDLGPLAEVLGRAAPAEAPRWLARWPALGDWESLERRARVLALLKDGAGAARALVEGRRRGRWALTEEVRAFDAWRAVAPAVAGDPKPPASWVAARVFWKKKAAEVGGDLALHLRAHPHDLLAARASLRTAAPGDEEPMRLAMAIVADPSLEPIGSPAQDAAFLRLRAARGLLPRSWRAARAALEPIDPSGLAAELRRRRIASAEINAALADVARIAARADQPAGVEPALAALEDRRPEEARAVRAEIAEARKPQGPPASFRLAGGKPALYRPRDLDWTVVTAAVEASTPPPGAEAAR